MLKKYSFDKEREGELIMLFGIFLWALFPIISILSYNSLSPMISLVLSTFCSTVFFGIIITLKKQWKNLKNIHNSKNLKNILYVTLYIAILYYSFVFWGMKYTSSGNVAIFLQMELLYTVLFFNVWKKEYLSLEHILGIILLAGSAFILVFPKELIINQGDVLILIGCIFAPIGNYYSKKAIHYNSAEEIMFIRSALSIPFLLLFAYLLGDTISFEDVKSSFLLIILNGIFIFGLSKICWLEALRRISITKAASLGSITPFLTVVLAYFLLKEIPTMQQIIAILPMMIGVLLLTSKKKLFKKK